MGDMIKPVIYSGLILGFAVALPLVSLGCCAWALGGGILSVYFYKRFNKDEDVEEGKGALLGLLSGLVAAPIAAFVGGLISLMVQGLIFKILSTLGAEYKDILAQTAINNTFTVVGMLMNLLIYLAIFGIFSTAGGLLGAVIFKKKKTGEPLQ